MWMAIGLLALGLTVLAWLALCFVIDFSDRIEALEAAQRRERPACAPLADRPGLSLVGQPDPFHPDGDEAVGRRNSPEACR